MESGTTKIMGIVNLNADSFYEPSRAATQAAFRRRVDALLAQGADILDLGAVSSRPGATDVEVDEEWSRLEPALETLRLHYPGVPVSIDTFRSSIVIMAYQEFGRFWVNDISAGEWDEAMLRDFAVRAKAAGVTDWVLDPGFGFSKSDRDNQTLFDRLDELKSFRRPILVGVSRKRFIWRPRLLTPATCDAVVREYEERAAAMGAAIIRTHL